MTLEKGLWLDDPWRLLRTPQYWASLQEHGYTTADLMIDTAKMAWDPMFTAAEVELFVQMAIGHDIEPVALGWPAPRKLLIDAMLRDFEQYARLGVAALGLDTEHLWRSEYLCGFFRTLSAAATYLLERLSRIRERYDVRIELTTHPGHREASSRATLTPFVDRFYLQSYSTRHDWRGNLVPWGGRLGPGRRQTEDITRVRNVLQCLTDGTVRLCIGQALWDQQWPGHTIDEALGAAYDATGDGGVEFIRDWSSKWGVGVKSKSKRQQKVAAWLRKRFTR